MGEGIVDPSPGPPGLPARWGGGERRSGDG